MNERKVFERTCGTFKQDRFGSQLHKEDYVADGTPIVTVEHLGNKMFSEQNLPRVSNTDKNRLKKYDAKTRQILYLDSVGFCRIDASYVDQKHDGWNVFWKMPFEYAQLVKLISEYL